MLGALVLISCIVFDVRIVRKEIDARFSKV
jgi:hypothetical protein